MLKNEDETIEFFRDVERRLHFGLPVYLDISRVRILAPDVIVYLLALMDVRKQLGDLKVAGNVPVDPAANSLWHASGFGNYISNPGPVIPRADVMAIKSGVHVDPELIGGATDWVSDRLGVPQSHPLMVNAYETLIECVANTWNHAYRDSQADVSAQQPGGALRWEPKWWLAALHIPDEQRVEVTVLDVGLGIPGTLQSKWQGFFERLGVSTQHGLVRAALEGNRPSSTGLTERGKGLPAMYQAAQTGQLRRFTVVSGRAYLNFHDAREHDLKERLIGTLYTWSLSTEGVRYEHGIE